MKKLLFTLLLLAAASATMSAYDFESYGIYYDFINSNEVKVVAGENKYTGDVHIPSSVYIGGPTIYSVTTIGSDAFNDCHGLTLVSIPASVTTIEANAFAGCDGLQILVIQGLTPPSATLLAQTPITIIIKQRSMCLTKLLKITFMMSFGDSSQTCNVWGNPA